MVEKIVYNVNNINNSPNEILNGCTINKNFEKLYQNDLELAKVRYSLNEGRINPYLDGYSYNKDDVVWFRTISPITNKSEIFVLRSILSNNIHRPVIELIEGSISFEKSGWVDCQEFATYVQNDLSNYIKDVYNERIALEHQALPQYHKYDQIQKDELSNILLLKDLSNIDKDRRYIHYPYETIELSTNNVILGGYYRKWDCGLLEYDIIFRLGYTGNIVEKNGVYYDEVKCNTLELSSDKYYMEAEDAQIFKMSADVSEEYIYLNDVAETNHNPFMNSYSSKLIFQEPFINENYMIFGSQIRNYCQDINNEMIGYNMNTLTYTNRFNDSICPVYITYTKDRYTKSALVLNNFHCQVIGRWR